MKLPGFLARWPRFPAIREVSRRFSGLRPRIAPTALPWILGPLLAAGFAAAMVFGGLIVLLVCLAALLGFGLLIVLWRGRLSSEFPWLMASFLGIFFGLASIALSIKMVLILLGALIGLGVLFVPSGAMLLLLIGLVFLLVGPLLYFFGINIAWGPYLLGLAMAARCFLDFISGRTRSWQGAGVTALMAALTVFLVIAVFSTAVDFSSLYILMVSGRNYFFLWGAFFLIAYSVTSEAILRKAWWMLLTIGVVQAPLAIYQRLFVVSTRKDNASWDAVVGSFPGYSEAGGDSGGMALFLCCLLAVGIALWRNKCLAGWKMLFLFPVYLLPIFAGEVKIVFALLPVVFFMAFRRDLLRNPALGFAGLAVGICLLAAVAVVYEKINTSAPASSMSRAKTLEERVDLITRFSTGTDVYMAYGEMGRVTALKFWWQKNSLENDPLSLLVGNGLGSSATSSYVELGEIGKRYYPLHFDNSTAAVLLWETGLLGLLAFLAMVLAPIPLAFRLARREDIPSFHRAVLGACPTLLLMMALTVFYNKGLVGASMPTQLLFLVVLGYVVHWATSVSTVVATDRRAGRGQDIKRSMPAYRNLARG